jgi:sugar phosphate isomerase/epimerase
MNLALSNLAWDYEEGDLVFEKLRNNNIGLIELILTKINDWEYLNEDSILDFSKKIYKNNLNVKTIQSIFYNITCHSICDEKVILPHFEKLIYYGNILSCETLVFGSPTLRNCRFFSNEKINQVFIKIDEMLDNTNINLSIEPNTKLYGGEFFFNNQEIIDFIKKNNLKNIKTMIDTHNLIHEGLSPDRELIENYEFINHIHISEENLNLLKKNKFHENFSRLLKKIGYNKVITYEVKKQKKVWDSVKLFSDIYG